MSWKWYGATLLYAVLWSATTQGGCSSCPPGGGGYTLPLECTVYPPCNDSIAQIFYACSTEIENLGSSTECSFQCQFAIAEFFENRNCAPPSTAQIPVPTTTDPVLIALFAQCQYLIVPLPVNSPPTQLEVWDTMWNQMAVHYPFFCIRGVNWFAVDALYRPQITADTTDDQLFALIASALSLFNDAHLLLIDANTTSGEVFLFFQGGNIPTYLQSPLKEVWQNLTDQNYLTGVTNVIPGVLDFARVTYHPTIGYIRINSFTNYGSLADLQAAWDVVATQLAGEDSIIVDVRANAGGDDLAAATAASRFTEMAFLGLEREARVVSTLNPECAFNYTPLHSLCIFPETPNLTNRRVIVLTSAGTVSAAAIFVLFMKTIPRHSITVIGETTQGVYSDVLNYWLPNGWLGFLPYELYFDSCGNVLEGVGQNPDRFVALEPERLFQGYDHMLQVAINILSKPRRCRA